MCDVCVCDVCARACVCVCVSASLSICLPVHLSACPSVCLSICLPVREIGAVDPSCISFSFSLPTPPLNLCDQAWHPLCPRFVHTRPTLCQHRHGNQGSPDSKLQPGWRAFPQQRHHTAVPMSLACRSHVARMSLACRLHVGHMSRSCCTQTQSQHLHAPPPGLSVHQHQHALVVYNLPHSCFSPAPQQMRPAGAQGPAQACQGCAAHERHRNEPNR